MVTLVPGAAASTSFSSFVDRVLNAPQLLQASMTTSLPPLALALAAALAGALAFFAGAASAGAARLVPFFGGILYDACVSSHCVSPRSSEEEFEDLKIFFLLL